MRTTSRAIIVSSVVAGALAAVVACSDAATIEPCNDIPAGGCPLSNGVACQDPTCSAVYACRANRQWELDHVCPPLEAGAPEASTEGGDGGDGGDATSDGPREGSRPFDASIDAPPGAGGGPGCEDLQAPDCSLAVGLACPMGCCGCEDLFVCNNGGWDYYASCTQ